MPGTAVERVAIADRVEGVVAAIAPVVAGQGLHFESIVAVAAADLVILTAGLGRAAVLVDVVARAEEDIVAAFEAVAHEIVAAAGFHIVEAAPAVGTVQNDFVIAAIGVDFHLGAGVLDDVIISIRALVYIGHVLVPFCTTCCCPTFSAGKLNRR